MRHVVQVRLGLAEELEACVIVGERVGPVVTAGLFRHEFPVVQILLGPSHRISIPATSISQCKQVQETIADQPRQSNHFMSWFRPLQQECRTTVITDEPGDLFPSRQVTIQFTEDSPHEVLSPHGVLGRRDPSGVGIDLRGQWLGRIMKQSGEGQQDAFVRSQ